MTTSAAHLHQLSSHFFCSSLSLFLNLLRIHTLMRRNAFFQTSKDSSPCTINILFVHQLTFLFLLASLTHSIKTNYFYFVKYFLTFHLILILPHRIRKCSSENRSGQNCYHYLYEHWHSSDDNLCCYRW